MNAASSRLRAADDRVLTLPNVLSTLRLVGVPLFVVCLATGRDGLAVLVLMLSGVTDYLDGRIARQYGLESKIGALLDPIADRLYITTTVLGLAWRQIIPWWLVLALLLRETVLTVLVGILRLRQAQTLPVHFIGKAATFNLLSAFPLLLLGEGATPLAQVAQIVGWAFVWWGVALYYVSGAHYAAQAIRVLWRRAPDRPRS